jgi:hypothetical protein
MRNKTALMAWERILAIILILLAFGLVFVMVNRGDISSKLKNLLPDYGFEEGEDLGEVGEHVKVEPEDYSDLLEEIKKTGVNGVSEGPFVITDTGWLDTPDRFVISWDFNKNKAIIKLYPNNKGLGLPLDEVRDVEKVCFGKDRI